MVKLRLDLVDLRGRFRIIGGLETPPAGANWKAEVANKGKVSGLFTPYLNMIQPFCALVRYSGSLLRRCRVQMNM